jgi:hypothetical protein
MRRGWPRVSTIVMAGVLLMACGHGAGAKEVETPSGESALRVECWDHREECVAEAERTCPGGYTVLDQQAIFAARGSGSGGRDIFTITIRCN